jgi:hypothetical protein
LRFFTLKNGNLKKYQQDGLETLADFLTKYAEQVSSKEVAFDYAIEEKVFTNIFAVLKKVLGKDVFSKDGESSKQFHAFQYEAISVAMASVIDKMDVNNTGHCPKVRGNILALKQDPKFQDATKNRGDKQTSGKAYLPFLDKRVSIAKKFISKGF